MDTIAVIDDRKEMRESVAEVIRIGLEDLGLAWNVVDMAPLPDLSNYDEWISSIGLRVLVLDENLSEELVEGVEGVGYLGHQVATIVRELHPDLPQFIITSVGNTEDLENAGELDAIVQRDEFNTHSDVYVERMVRLGNSFARRYESELADLTLISEKVAFDTATEEERRRLNALRNVRVTRPNLPDVEDMSNWLERASSAKRALEDAMLAVKGKGG